MKSIFHSHKLRRDHAMPLVVTRLAQKIRRPGLGRVLSNDRSWRPVVFFGSTPATPRASPAIDHVNHPHHRHINATGDQLRLGDPITTAFPWRPRPALQTPPAIMLSRA